VQASCPPRDATPHHLFQQPRPRANPSCHAGSSAFGSSHAMAGRPITATTAQPLNHTHATVWLSPEHSCLTGDSAAASPCVAHPHPPAVRLAFSTPVDEAVDGRVRHATCHGVAESVT
jgi:hypothetical protein